MQKQDFHPRGFWQSLEESLSRACLLASRFALGGQHRLCLSPHFRFRPAVGCRVGLQYLLHFSLCLLRHLMLEPMCEALIHTGIHLCQTYTSDYCHQAFYESVKRKKVSTERIVLRGWHGSLQKQRTKLTAPPCGCSAMPRGTLC